MWKKYGILLKISKKKISDGDILELAIKAGAEDCVSNDQYHEIITKKDDFYKVKLEIEPTLI